MMRTVWKWISLIHVSSKPEFDSLVSNVRPCDQTRCDTGLERPHTWFEKHCLVSGWKESWNQKELSSFCQRDFELISGSPLLCCVVKVLAVPCAAALNHSRDVTGYPGASGNASKARDHGLRSAMAMKSWGPVVLSEESDPEVKHPWSVLLITSSHCPCLWSSLLLQWAFQMLNLEPHLPFQVCCFLNGPQNP